MKKLVAIAIAVIAALAVLVYFWHPADPTLAPADKPQQPQTPAHGVDSEPTSAGAQPASPAGERSTPVAAPLTDEQKLAACSESMVRLAKRNEGILAAEPKDPAWAYPMEQKLRESLSRRLQSNQIDVVGIDCRTYSCTVRVQSFDPERTAKAFAEAIGAITNEPWSEFTGIGTSHEEDSGKTFHIARMTRPGAPEVREAPKDAQALTECSELQSRQQEQRRAKLNAQERDAGWAEPMEYRLREYLTAQLSKQPIDPLDISCRTTFCRIQTSGRTNDSESAFHKAAQDASKEPWANLWYAEVEGQAENGEWDGSVTLYRRQ